MTRTRPSPPRAGGAPAPVVALATVVALAAACGPRYDDPVQEAQHEAREIAREFRAEAAPEQRAEAAEEITEVLRQARDDNDEATVEAVSAEALPVLREALADEAPQVRRQVAWAFTEMTVEEVEEVLPELEGALASDEDPAVRSGAALALHRYRKQRRLPRERELAVRSHLEGVLAGLARELESPDEEVRFQAVTTAKELEWEARPLEAKLVELARHDPVDRIRAKALMAMVEQHTKITPALFHEIRRSDNRRVRMALIIATDAQAHLIPELTRVALADPDPEQRELAVHALGIFGQKPLKPSLYRDHVLPPLRKALRDEDSDVRERAEWAIDLVEKRLAGG